MNQNDISKDDFVVELRKIGDETNEKKRREIHAHVGAPSSHTELSVVKRQSPLVNISKLLFLWPESLYMWLRERAG